jgi:hypothetical protein
MICANFIVEARVVSDQSGLFGGEEGDGLAREALQPLL